MSGELLQVYVMHREDLLLAALVDVETRRVVEVKCEDAPERVHEVFVALPCVLGALETELVKGTISLKECERLEAVAPEGGGQ